VTVVTPHPVEGFNVASRGSGSVVELLISAANRGRQVPGGGTVYTLQANLDGVPLGLLVLGLVLPLAALAIKLEDGGAVFYQQERMGKYGRRFTIYKLRSMAVEAPSYSYKVAINDPRITRVGRWLRRSGLDELPQLWNVLRGDMSLIGPRPELPFIVDQYQNGERRRHEIRPGITGWWQIHHRNEVPMHLNLDYDFYYLDNMSLRLDILIARRTIKIMVAGLRHNGRRTDDAEQEQIAGFS